MKTWGIYDTKDRCWLGNDQGPLQSDKRILARAAMTIINEQFDSGVRFRIQPLPPKPFKLKDTIEAKLTGAEALAKIEGK